MATRRGRHPHPAWSHAAGLGDRGPSRGRFASRCGQLGTRGERLGTGACPLEAARLSKTSAEPATPHRLAQIVEVVHAIESSTELQESILQSPEPEWLAGDAPAAKSGGFAAWCAAPAAHAADSGNIRARQRHARCLSGHEPDRRVPDVELISNQRIKNSGSRGPGSNLFACQRARSSL